jgi:2-amino-4-hydroxy-6-hydroxymethyldihydropteridine diphosphokinase
MVIRQPHKVYIGIGTNLGDRFKNIDQAINHITQELNPSSIRISTLVESEPWGFDSKELFLNGCLEVQVFTDPFELLKILKNIELKMGRKNKGKENYTDRIIDLDILFFDDLQMDTPELTIPHPHLQFRDFVLKPLKEIAPTFKHPKLNLTIQQLYHQFILDHL